MEDPKSVRTTAAPEGALTVDVLNNEKPDAPSSDAATPPHVIQKEESSRKIHGIKVRQQFKMALIHRGINSYVVSDCLCIHSVFDIPFCPGQHRRCGYSTCHSQLIRTSQRHTLDRRCIRPWCHCYSSLGKSVRSF